MSCWGNRRPAASYVSKLDLTLRRQKANRFNSNVLESPSRVEKFGGLSDFDDPVSSVPALKKNFADAAVNKSRNYSGGHCSRIDITLQKTDRRKDVTKCPFCACACPCSSSNRLHMPWRYSSSCKDTQGTQTCLGQGGFAPDHGCGFTKSLPHNQYSTKLQDTSCFSSGDDHVQIAEFFPSISKSKSSCTSRLDVVLTNNSTVSMPQSNNPPTVFTSRSQEHSSKEYGENVTKMTNLKDVNMYISSCSLTVHPSQTKCQGGNYAQSVLLMPPGDKSPNEYALDLQSPHKGFIMSEAPTLQITQFQVTRSPASPPSLQQTSTRDIWVSPESLPSVSGSSVNPDLVPNVVVFQRSCSPIVGRRTDLYPVLIPTQHKASKITLLIGSNVAPVPVQVIQEYNRCATPAIFISNGDTPTSSEDLGSGFLLSVNPLSYSKQRHMETQRSPPLTGVPPARCKPPEPYLYPPPCTVMPRIPSGRESSAPIAVTIEAYGSRRGAVKISISHSRDPNSHGMGS